MLLPFMLYLFLPCAACLSHLALEEGIPPSPYSTPSIKKHPRWLAFTLYVLESGPAAVEMSYLQGT
jgi:hypothetical protein